MSGAAAADPAKTPHSIAVDVAGAVLSFAGGATETPAPRLGILDNGFTVVDRSYDRRGRNDPTEAKDELVAYSADKQVAWVVANMDHAALCAGCKVDRAHATVVLDKGPAWHVLAYSIEHPVSDADQAKALKAGIVPKPIARKVDAGAEDAVKLFESTLADPKAFAASVSDRKDASLFGSGATERFVGGAAVRAQLAKWKLKLALRDGLQAGLAGPTIVWIGANVDASGSPYRLLAIYEKTGASWQLVHAHFSVVTEIRDPMEP